MLGAFIRPAGRLLGGTQGISRASTARGLSLLVVVPEVSRRGAPRGSHRNSADLRHWLLQHEIDRRALLGDTEHDRDLPIVEPDILPLFPHYDEVSGEDRNAVTRNRVVLTA